jgi:hypothetical protein
VPALGMGLHQFQHGRLTVSDPEVVARIRAHPWFGVRIFELTKEEAAASRADPWGEARLRDREDEKKTVAAERRSRCMMGPRGPLGPKVELAQFPVRSRPTAPTRTPYPRTPIEGRLVPRDRSFESMLPPEWRSRR